MIAATAIVPTPPMTTEKTGPNIAATVPDSNAPSSFDVPMNRPLSADTRPRMSSGVAVWTRVERTTTLMLSHTPRMKSMARDSGKDREIPKTMVAAPKQATASQNRSSRAAKGTAMRLRYRGNDGACGRRGQETAESEGSDVEDVRWHRSASAPLLRPAVLPNMSSIITASTTFVLKMNRSPAESACRRQRTRRRRLVTV